MMKTIFKTTRFQVRKLRQNDLASFDEMQGNYQVMKYVRGKAMTFEENKKELTKLIASYAQESCELKVYAVENKEDSQFVGTVALIIGENGSCEIGYRFIQKYWGNRFGSEILTGLINYCRRIGLIELIAHVAVANPASEKMLKNEHFIFNKDVVFPDLNIPERKYILRL